MADKLWALVQRLPGEQHRCVRSIVLHENRKAVAQPERHLQGLIPFYHTNHQLHVERRITFTESMLPMGLQDIDRAELQESDREPQKLYEMNGHVYLTAFVQWMQEAVKLSRQGIPQSCFKVVLGGSEEHDTTPSAWQLILKAAAIHEAFMQVSCHLRRRIGYY